MRVAAGAAMLGAAAREADNGDEMFVGVLVLGRPPAWHVGSARGGFHGRPVGFPPSRVLGPDAPGPITWCGDGSPFPVWAPREGNQWFDRALVVVVVVVVVNPAAAGTDGRGECPPAGRRGARVRSSGPVIG